MLRLSPLGDRAILVTFGEGLSVAMSARVRAAALRLRETRPPAVSDIVSAYASLAVHYDPARVACRAGEPPYDVMAREVAHLLYGAARGDVATPAGRVLEIPVRYGGDAGPDLAALAEARGLAPDEAVALHAAPEYLVQMVGFVPGFPYLTGLDERLATPRRATPRTSVPPGSVGIGGAQTGIYPVEAPGGWHLIGRTPLALFDATREPATLLAAGDRVRFRAIGDEEFAALAASTG